MDIQYIRKLLKVVNEAGIQEIEIEEGGSRVRITRDNPAHAVFAQAAPVYAPPPPGASPRQEAAFPVPAVEASAPPAEAKPASGQIIVSPIVGTFYRAPSPDAAPYVQVGQMIQVGAVVCIIEAMKIMNEIESEYSGRISKILVENGQPVEYNQPLFVVETE
jgi:acetyl-CoA carboxylase biotin carboxyl carrier protein